ncbi:MAG: 16S rRNA (cytidine(1402)-2'-O)-methyltransferase [Finegoldia sp.]|nr:16S rRNA (cytidine(1402)-2'-O)-methyltransferase [Finegoldia sp.]
MEESKIYIVATPIGNMEDITIRSLKVLKEVDTIYCEDTRNTIKLLKHYGISTPLISYHEHNEKSRSQEIIERVQMGEICAVVSDAGMPGISDPGQVLIQAAIENGVDIEVLPGPTAFATALVRSGFDNSTFKFMGFIPRKNKDKIDFYEKIKNADSTVIIYESVHRIIDSLKELKDVLGKRRICLCRELTKIYESVYIGQVSEVLKALESDFVKGEFVIVIEKNSESVCEDIDIKAELIKLIDRGMSKKDAVSQIASSYNIKKNLVYKESLEI